MVHARHGALAVEVLQELILLGFTTLTALESHMLSRNQAKSAKPQINGNGPENSEEDILDVNDSQSTTRLRKVVQKLVSEGYIVRARLSHAHSFFDARQNVENQLKGIGLVSSVKGKKAQVEIDDKIDFELEKLTDNVVSRSTIDNMNSSKRSAPDDDGYPSAKRTKTDNSYGASGMGIFANGMPPSIEENENVVCVSYSNVVSWLRSEQFAKVAEKTVSKPAGRVLGAALRQINLLSDPWKSQTDAFAPIAPEIVDLHTLRQTLNSSHHESNHHEPYQNGHRANGVNHGDTDGHEHEEEELFTDEDIDRNFALLAEGPFDFLIWDGHHWMIDKRKASVFLQQQEVMRLTRDRVAPPALRLLRMLHDKGKLDEKSIQELGLLGAKDLRQNLALLQTMGLLELQEVPRDPQRQANRTIFLWFYDAERASKVLLDALYKAITRMLQRMLIERSKLASTLSKIERSDVQGSEAELLAQGEMQVLQQWRRREEWFRGEVNRLDDSVAILRDL